MAVDEKKRILKELHLEEKQDNSLRPFARASLRRSCFRRVSLVISP